MRAMGLGDADLREMGRCAAERELDGRITAARAALEALEARRASLAHFNFGAPVPAVSVFVRVRPLQPNEGSVSLAGLALGSSDAAQPAAVAFASAAGCELGGFHGVLGTDADNAEVFRRCMAERLGTVRRGGTASLFCHGYTGSGKTHTVLGYGPEKGVFFEAAERLLLGLGGAEAGGAEAGEAGEAGGAEVADTALFLRATACEVYNDEVFDLLGAAKVPCTLRTDELGRLCVVASQGATALEGADTGVAAERLGADGKPRVAGSALATLVTHVEGLRSVAVRSPSDLGLVGRSAVAERAAGSSTQHGQSSRSHAILKLEVVSGRVVAAQAALDAARELAPARKAALDNAGASAAFATFCDGYCTVLRAGLPGGGALAAKLAQVLWVGSSPVVESDIRVMHTDEDNLLTLKGPGCAGEAARTLADWQIHFGQPELKQTTAVRLRPEYADVAALEAKAEELAAIRERVSALHDETLAAIGAAQAELAAVLAAGPAVLGGSLLLVDLAGADYDHRAGGAQRESAAINKSLLALKECMRSLAGQSRQRPNYRASKLTRMLQDALEPSKASARRNRESVSVMLVNVSPAAELERMTLNSLRYGQMYATGAAGGKKAKAATTKGATRGGGAPKPWERKGRGKGEGSSTGAPATPQPCALAVLAALRAVYREHAPAKSAEDVEAILRKFEGREEWLLGKVKAKYQE